MLEPVDCQEGMRVWHSDALVTCHDNDTLNDEISYREYGRCWNRLSEGRLRCTRKKLPGPPLWAFVPDCTISQLRWILGVLSCEDL